MLSNSARKLLFHPTTLVKIEGQLKNLRFSKLHPTQPIPNLVENDNNQQRTTGKNWKGHCQKEIMIVKSLFYLIFKKGNMDHNQAVSNMWIV